ncbi:MAG: hypothetical protein AAF985_23455, partial [Bacteroidota bacterium]
MRTRYQFRKLWNLMILITLAYLAEAQVSYNYPFEGDGGFIYYENMMNKPWYQSTWPGTHNSYSNNGEPSIINHFVYDYKVKHYVEEVYGWAAKKLMVEIFHDAANEDASSLNQYLSMEDQLKGGIRFMKLDIVPLYEANGIDIELMGGNYSPDTYFIHGDNVVGMAKIKESLQKIADWLGNNAHEILIWDIDILQDKGAIQLSEWKKWNG